MAAAVKVSCVLSLVGRERESVRARMGARENGRTRGDMVFIFASSVEHAVGGWFNALRRWKRERPESEPCVSVCLNTF